MNREQTTIRLPVELKAKLQQQADEMGASLNFVIIRYLRKGLEVE